MAQPRRLGLGLSERPRAVLPIAAVTGLVAEARIVRRLGFRAEAAGGDPEATRAACARLVAEGAGALLSFGICGGLDPRLASGMLILPHGIRSEEGKRFTVDSGKHRALAAALSAAGLAATTDDIFGASVPAETPERKAALFRQSGAVAIDLESHHVARAAAAAGLPFVVLRAVADTAARGLPLAALVGLDREGRAALGRVLLSLARGPRQLPALLGLARDTRRALVELRRAAQAARGVLPGSV
jgi:adenosylhomocysteine nucleosidase